MYTENTEQWSLILVIKGKINRLMHFILRDKKHFVSLPFNNSALKSKGHQYKWPFLSKEMIKNGSVDCKDHPSELHFICYHAVVSYPTHGRKKKKKTWKKSKTFSSACVLPCMCRVRMTYSWGLWAILYELSEEVF